jgi:hypothetical protein
MPANKPVSRKLGEKHLGGLQVIESSLAFVEERYCGNTKQSAMV